VTVEELRDDLKSLEKSFNMLSQKWNLEILYTLFLKDAVSFSSLKRVLGVNSRTLSNKLKNLQKYGYIDRRVHPGPPLRVEYALTRRGRETVLLALPLLYYSSGLF
ncbi:MAG: helix-turn-helix domain-containing protein, partial [Candidatus Bathyarchaeia archaeon]